MAKITIQQARENLDTAFNTWVALVYNIPESDTDSSAFNELLDDIESMA